MNVIPTKTFAVVRAWRWAVDTMTVFWIGFGTFIRRELASAFRRHT